MNWERADELLKEYGYEVHQVARRAEGAYLSDIVKKVYKKDGKYPLEAEVFTTMEQCESCWKVRIKFYGLKYFMAIDSQDFSLRINSDLFFRVERQVLEYIDACLKIH